MYCVKCGVQLADTEKKCPLCGTTVFHPDIVRPDTEPLYPVDRYPDGKVRPTALLIMLSTLFLIALLIPTLCDLRLHRSITWSGYVIGALVIGYIAVILPAWFKKPNPIVFVPTTFLAVGFFLAYINASLNGRWFWSFAFPLVGGIALVVTTVVVLMYFYKKAALYIFGGAAIALGVMMYPLEILINLTFDVAHFSFWSLYPLCALCIIGLMLIFIAIYRPARESLERLFFV